MECPACPWKSTTLYFHNLTKHVRDQRLKELRLTLAGQPVEELHNTPEMEQWLEDNVQMKYIAASKQMLTPVHALIGDFVKNYQSRGLYLYIYSLLPQIY